MAFCFLNKKDISHSFSNKLLIREQGKSLTVNEVLLLSNTKRCIRLVPSIWGGGKMTRSRRLLDLLKSSRFGGYVLSNCFVCKNIWRVRAKPSRALPQRQNPRRCQRRRQTQGLNCDRL